MPRSAADATRFTATLPHASSLKSTTSSSSMLPNSSRTTPAGETSQEKVARLRAAANRAKAGKLSPVDKIFLRGRVWADRAHRVVTLGLVGLTGIAFIYATVATTDMLMYNRRKRKEYFASQKLLLETSIADAAAAEARGIATEEQLALLERERAHAAHEAELAANKKPGIMARIKAVAFADLKKEENDPSSAGICAGIDGEEEGGSGGVLAQVKAIHAERDAEELQRRKGGMLDKLGERPPGTGADGEEAKGKSWTRWLSIRR